MLASATLVRMTDVPADVINGFVALGTLALATATTFTLASARRDGVDRIAPRIVVTQLDFLDVKAESQIAGKTPSMAAGTPWDARQYAETSLALTVAVNLVNEGESTGFFKFDGLGVESAGFTDMDTGDSLRAYTLTSLAQQNGWYIMPPHREAVVYLTWWNQTKAWNVPGGLSKTLVLTSRGALADSPVDTCRLSLRATLFAEEQGHLVIANQDTAAKNQYKAPLKITEIGFLTRAYRKQRNRSGSDTNH